MGSQASCCIHYFLLHPARDITITDPLRFFRHLLVHKSAAGTGSRQLADSNRIWC